MNFQTKKIKKIKKPKKTKGGLFTSLGKDGSLIPENLKYEVKMKQDDSLIDEYKIRKENAESNYKLLDAKYKQKDKELNDEDKKQQARNEYYLRIQIFVVSIIKSILTAIFKVSQEFIRILQSGFKAFYLFAQLVFRTARDIFDIGKGVIPKTIVLILFILVCVGGTIGFFSNPSNASKFDFNNSTNMNFYFKTPKPSFLSSFSQTMVGFVPQQYRYNFTAFKNSVNKSLGNDLIANHRNKYNREIIEEGRNDGILHIKYNDDKANTYSSLKPNDLKWVIDIDKYPNSDFFKLPINIQKLYKNANNELTIPIKTENGRYVQKLENAYFGNNPDNTIMKSTGTNLFPYFDDVSSIYGNTYKIKKFSNDYIYKNTDKNFGDNVTNTFNIDKSGNGNVVYPIENINDKLGI